MQHEGEEVSKALLRRMIPFSYSGKCEKSAVMYWWIKDRSLSDEKRENETVSKEVEKVFNSFE